MLTRYRTTTELDNQGNTVWRVHGVPLFGEIVRKAVNPDGSVRVLNYNAEFINIATAEGRRRQEENGHRPTLYIEHKKKGQLMREVAGFLENQKAVTVFYNGKPIRATSCDLIIISEEIAILLENGQFPGISVEIKPTQENNPRSYTSAALLNEEPPALMFPPLIAGTPESNLVESFSQAISMEECKGEVELICFSQFMDIEEPNQEARLNELKIKELEINRQLSEIHERSTRNYLDTANAMDLSTSHETRMSLARDREALVKQLDETVASLRKIQMEIRTLTVSAPPDTPIQEVPVEQSFQQKVEKGETMTSTIENPPKKEGQEFQGEESSSLDQLLLQMDESQKAQVMEFIKGLMNAPKPEEAQQGVEDNAIDNSAVSFSQKEEKGGMELLLPVLAEISEGQKALSKRMDGFEKKAAAKSETELFSQKVEEQFLGSDRKDFVKTQVMETFSQYGEKAAEKQMLAFSQIVEVPAKPLTGNTGALPPSVDEELQEFSQTPEHYTHAAFLKKRHAETGSKKTVKEYVGKGMRCRFPELRNETASTIEEDEE